MPQPHPVGHEQQDPGGRRPLAQPPEPPGEGRAVRGAALAHDGDGATPGEGEGRVRGQGTVPAEADGPGQCGDRRGEAVDGGDSVEPLQEEASPCGRDGKGAQHVGHGPVLLPRQLAQPGGGHVKAPRGRRQLRGMGNGGDEPRVFQPADGLVHRAPRPAGEGDQLQAVEEGHGGKPPQQVARASGQLHASSSLAASGEPASPPRERRLLCCPRRSELPGPGSPLWGLGGASAPSARASRPLR